jgi:S1-C subfamily serine protease
MARPPGNTRSHLRRAYLAAAYGVVSQEGFAAQFKRIAAEEPAGSGSGFAWDDRGTIITNFHVVQGARALR